MPGPRFDWGTFLEQGGQFAYDILSTEQKHKRKVQGLIDEEKRKQEERERDREDTRKDFGMGVIEKVITGDFNPHTKQKFAQWGIEQGWIDPGILGLGVTPPPATPKAEFGTPEYWQQGAQMGAMPPLRPEDMAGVGALYEPSAVAEEGKGELFGVAEKEKTYKEKVTKWVEEHPTEPYPGLTMEKTQKVLGAYVAPEKGPTPPSPEKIREQAYRLTTSVMRGPQFQELLSGLDPKARIKFEKDFAQMLERTYKFLQAGQFPEMRRTEEEWDEIYGE